MKIRLIIVFAQRRIRSREASDDEQGLAPKYSVNAEIYQEESENKIQKGDKGVIRFKVLNKEVEFNDLIRGKIKFDANLFGDIVIAKNLKEPLYNFVVAIDDHEMKISHIIRGEDHLSNTLNRF